MVAIPLLKMLHSTAQKMETARNNGWIRGNRLPEEADGDNAGWVLVWHVYQGAMLAKWWDYSNNRFYAYWMPLSALHEMDWNNAAQVIPTAADADALNCVLVEDRWGDLKVTGYHQFTWNKTLVRWRRLPAPPPDAKELRQRI